jgi:hypothetical protein
MLIMGTIYKSVDDRDNYINYGIGRWAADSQEGLNVLNKSLICAAWCWFYANSIQKV